MMSNYTIEVLDGENILLMQLGEEFDLVADFEGFNTEAVSLLDQATEPMFAVIDVMQFPQVSIDGLIQATNASTTGYLSHENLQTILTVTDSKLFQLAIKGIRTATFGNLDAHWFTTTEEALEFARTQA